MNHVASLHDQHDAVDASESARPGIPAESAPEPVANAHWLTPDKQTPSRDVLREVGREELTATFGTGQPPSGVSGVIRRAAYKLPDYRVRRWLMLLAADRVDALESRIVDNRVGRTFHRLSASRKDNG